MRRFAPIVVPLLILFATPSLATAQTANLTVGEKIIYGGGPDQPPKEKDTGVSLKINSVRGSDAPGGGGDSNPGIVSGDDDTYTVFLQTGRADDILTALEGRDDARSQAWRALALASLGRHDEATETATKALADPGTDPGNTLSTALRQKLQPLVSGTAKAP